MERGGRAKAATKEHACEGLKVGDRAEDEVMERREGMQKVATGEQGGDPRVNDREAKQREEGSNDP